MGLDTIRYCDKNRCTDECETAEHKQTHLYQCCVPQIRYRTLLHLSRNRGLRLVRKLVSRIPFGALLTVSDLVCRIVSEHEFELNDNDLTTCI